MREKHNSPDPNKREKTDWKTNKKTESQKSKGK